MHALKPCRRTRLAQCTFASIERCECSMLHLNIGAVTLRLEPGAFEALATMLHSALARHLAGEGSEAPELARALASATRGEA